MKGLEYTAAQRQRVRRDNLILAMGQFNPEYLAWRKERRRKKGPTLFGMEIRIVVIDEIKEIGGKAWMMLKRSITKNT